MKKNEIVCPNCKTELKVDELLINQFSESIKKDLNESLKEREDNIQRQREEFQLLNSQFEKEKSEMDILVQQKLKSSEDKLKEKIRQEVQEEKNAQLIELENSLKQKSSQLVELGQTKAKLKRLSMEFEEKEALLQVKMEEQIAERMSAARNSMKEQLQIESSLKISEKETLITSLKEKLNSAMEKIAQGSMQSQGESQELVLEELLRETHPSDLIQEIGKGVNGADCIQNVRIGESEIGKIIYESKNTKVWNSDFVKKLRQDNLAAKADLMVIVTKTMPKDVEGEFTTINGVFVTTLRAVRTVSLLLRAMILRTHSVIQSQEGKNDKAHLIYEYISSPTFAATLESILEGFKNLQDSHNDEKRKLQVLWKRRESYLAQVLASTVDFYGSVQSISQNSIPKIEMLEFKKAS